MRWPSLMLCLMRTREGWPLSTWALAGGQENHPNRNVEKKAGQRLRMDLLPQKSMARTEGMETRPWHAAAAFQCCKASVPRPSLLWPEGGFCLSVLRRLRTIGLDG